MNESQAEQLLGHMGAITILLQGLVMMIDQDLTNRDPNRKAISGDLFREAARAKRRGSEREPEQH